MSDGSYTYYDPLELYARVTKDYYLTTPNPVPADYLIDVKPVDKPHGSGVDSKKFHNDVGVVGLPSDVGHEYDEYAPRELVISIDSLLDSISLQLAYEGGSSVELSSAHGSIRFYTSSDEILYLDYVDGNVGIGTMSPLYKLDVVGVARFSDSVKVGEYWLPKEIGSMSQVLTVDSTGKLVWMSVKRAYALDTTVVCDAETSHNCVPWLLSDDVIFTANWYGGCCQGCTTAYYGIAKGNAGNVLNGVKRTHVNLGAYSTTGAGLDLDSFCVVSGGRNNRVLESFSIIVGGKLNEVQSLYGFIGGGESNLISWLNNTTYGVICGGDSNTVIGRYGAICGGHRNKVGDGRIGDHSAFIGGGEYNHTRCEYATILGGYADTVNGIAATITGGAKNVILSGNYSVICGGENNLMNDDKDYIDYSVILGGSDNIIHNNADYSLVFGNEVIVSDSYNAVFYNTDHRGKVGICEQNPHSTLHNHGSFAVNVSIVTNHVYTTTDTDMVILCNTSSNNIVINLPSVTTCEGRIYVIKKVSSDFNSVLIAPATGETIDDQPNYSLTGYNQRVQIVATSLGWKRID